MISDIFVYGFPVVSIIASILVIKLDKKLGYIFLTVTVGGLLIGLYEVYNPNTLLEVLRISVLVYSFILSILTLRKLRKSKNKKDVFIGNTLLFLLVVFIIVTPIIAGVLAMFK